MSTIPCIALSLSLFAFMGTETGSDTGTDTGTGSDTSTDTNSDGCGDNCSGPKDPKILMPADGAEVQSPFMVDVEPGGECWCDTCGCSFVDYDIIRILANGELVLSPSFGDLGPYQVELAPGSYQLVAQGDWDFGLGGESAPISITVVAGDPPDTTSGSESSGGGESGGGESGGNLTASDTGTTGDESPGIGADQACNCSASEGLPGLGTFALLGLLGLRRRRVS